jgi:hypothetical protein
VLFFCFLPGRRRSPGAYWQPAATFVEPLQVRVQVPVAVQEWVQAPLQVVAQLPVPEHATLLPAPTLMVAAPGPVTETFELLPVVIVAAPVPEMATLQLSPQVPLHEPVPLQVKLQLAMFALQVPSELMSHAPIPSHTQLVPLQMDEPQLTRGSASRKTMRVTVRMRPPRDGSGL